MQDRTFNCWSRHHSSYTSQHTPLIIHHSSYTTHHTPLNIHHSSFITCHTPLIIQDSSYIVSSLRVQDRFYIQIRIPLSPMCDMQGLPPLKNATVGCVSMWTASLASRGGRMCVISRRGHTHTLHTWNPVGQKSGARAFDWRTRMLERTWTLLKVNFFL